MENEQFALACQELRRELLGYLQYLTGRPAIAEELLQETLLRGHLHLAELPDEQGELRAWLFTVASRLAIDSLRKHGNWRETALDDFRHAAESNADFLSQSRQLVGTPETRNIAKEHLAACLTCVLRTFPEKKAAALLLKEIYGFGAEEVAGQLEASAIQIKNWLQETRASMNVRYGASCALLTKQGTCHQCIELDGFFNHGSSDPLQGSSRDFQARLAVLHEMKDKGMGRWHILMFGLLDDLG